MFAPCINSIKALFY